MQPAEPAGWRLDEDDGKASTDCGRGRPAQSTPRRLRTIEADQQVAERGAPDGNRWHAAWHRSNNRTVRIYFTLDKCYCTCFTSDTAERGRLTWAATSWAAPAVRERAVTIPTPKPEL